MLSRRDHGIVLSSEKLTVREFMDRWLEHMAVLGRDKRTLERYRELLELHALPTIGSLELKALGSVHLSELYAKLQRQGLERHGYSQRLLCAVKSAVIAAGGRTSKPGSDPPRPLTGGS